MRVPAIRLLILLPLLLPVSLAAETFTYAVTAMNQEIGSLTVHHVRDGNGSFQEIEMRGGIALLFTYTEFSLNAMLEYDARGELVSGTTRSLGPNLDKAFEFYRQGDEVKVSRSIQGRPWKNRAYDPFRATTLFIHNPSIIGNLINEDPQGGRIALLDIEKDRITTLEYTLRRDQMSPWGDVWIMEDREMTSVFDKETYRLLYTGVKIMGTTVETLLTDR